MKPSIFLRAEWRHLVLLNYEVEPELLEPHLPPQLELDYWNEKTYVSLVGFIFQRARLCGIKIPFHSSFPEVNLRFYVKRSLPEGDRHGVVFLKEIVPRRAVAFVARRVFGERFVALPLTANIELDERSKGAARREWFRWRLADDEFAIEAVANAELRYPAPGSLEEFIIEHYWGYSTDRGSDKRCIEYEVEHRPWLIRPADPARFTGRAGALYGREFGQVLKRPPDSAFFADGSAVAVRQGNGIVGLSRADSRQAVSALPRSSADELAANSRA